jgi:Immune inhibitor A peptidase M6
VQQSASAQAAEAPAAASATPTATVGTTRSWLALDDARGRLYTKPYTLRGVGKNIEVWVANDTSFPAGDCRTATPGSTTVTDAQVAGLVTEFDTNMYPKESAAFSTPPPRDGSKAALAGDFSGSGDKIVTLVDNVRDDNYYTFPQAPTYIAGFFSSQFNELVDRNVMTIDAFDWLHRTGADPEDEPTGDLCTSRPGRARLYEGVFAHEYQHLLQYYQDPAEVNFINEGLSDFAISLTGYGNTLARVDEKGAESHIYCFQGFGTVQTAYNTNPRACGGPQNSLTLWGDEGAGNEILADYGNAWSFQLFLFDRYGQAFTSALHRDGAHQGLEGVQAQLDAYAPGTQVADVLHDFQTMNLVDRSVDEGGTVVGRPVPSVTTKSLRATVNLSNPAAYAKPGAAPNGADYVALRGPQGQVVTGKALRSLSFTGARTLAPLPLAWSSTSTVTTATGTVSAGPNPPVLWSGNSSNLDAAAVTSVTVPTNAPTLTYSERHLAEEGYDYAYTVVSTDGGQTYTPLANANTVEGPLGPALNGDAAGFATQTFDLRAYAGKTVLLGFRYVSDGGVNDGGWYVDDVRVGGTLVSDGSSTAGFRSPSQVRPTAVANWHLRLVGLDAAKDKARVEVFDGRRSLTLNRARLANFSSFPRVVAIVSYDDPSEQVQQYAPYTLVVNGVTQPGGS